MMQNLTENGLILIWCDELWRVNFAEIGYTVGLNVFLVGCIIDEGSSRSSDLSSPLIVSYHSYIGLCRTPIEQGEVT